MFCVEWSFAVEAERGISDFVGRDGVVHRHIVAANNTAQCNFVLVAILPNGLRALNDHVVIRQDFHDGDGYLPAVAIGVHGRTVRLEIIGAARRKRLDEIENAGARVYVE